MGGKKEEKDAHKKNYHRIEIARQKIKRKGKNDMRNQFEQTNRSKGC